MKKEKHGELYKKISEYVSSDFYPFHMPGHKRNPELSRDTYGMDLTEIAGFDNLHHAEGILKDCMKRAATLYESDETFYLVNGSTSGILTAISAVCDFNNSTNTLLVARNCHKSVYNCILLNRINAKYLYPSYQYKYHINGGIMPADVQRALTEDPSIRAVVITSPTYEGVMSDVELIAEIVHAKGIPLIVDEAHGAHLKLDHMGAQSAITAGADIVIHSLHKTMPALTQTALLHIQGNLVNKDLIRRYLQIYQSSSPSYLLMASIDDCLNRFAKEKDREDAFYYLHKLRQSFNNQVSELKKISVVDTDIIGTGGIKDLDLIKIMISTVGTNLSGEKLMEILRDRYHIEMEMAGIDYVIGILTCFDTQEGIDRLATALLQIDSECKICKCGETAYERVLITTQNESKEPIATAMDSQNKRVRLRDSIGHIAAEFVYAYPPGIPILVPGEIISEANIECIEHYIHTGLSVQGLSDFCNKTIKIVDC